MKKTLYTVDMSCIYPDCFYWFVDLLLTTGSQRTTCRTCTNGRRSACCCCRLSALASASPGWCFAMKTSECREEVCQETQPVAAFESWILFHDVLCVSYSKITTWTTVHTTSLRVLNAFCVSGDRMVAFFCLCLITCCRYIMMMVWADSQSCFAPSRWAWVLQDALGIAFCLYMLKTVRLPTFKVGQLSRKL